MEIEKLRDFAKERGIELAKPKDIVSEATRNIKNKYGYSVEEVKANFDQLLEESEKEAYRLYLEYEKEYAARFLESLSICWYIRVRYNSWKMSGRLLVPTSQFWTSFCLSFKRKEGKSGERI